jgi:hypothetical protein
MEWGFLIPVVAIAIGPLAWVANNWIRAKHGYPLEDPDQAPDKKQAKLLATENQRLTGEVNQLHERIAVLERIVTDPAERTAREIEALRRD